MTSIKRSALTVLLLAIVALSTLTNTQPASADNTKDAQSVVVCSYNYDGVTYTQDMYVLDAPSKTNRINLESREQYYALWNVAGIAHHEYINYPAYPTTVVPTDLQGWHCKWSLGNTPTP